jgi:hypothetical protein
MSALPPKADIEIQSRDVRFVPKADILRCGKKLVIRSPVGAGEHLRRDDDAKRLGGPEVND